VADMTKEDLISELDNIAVNGDDTEIDHFNADELLLQYINDEDVSAAYGYIPKWYS
jgi:hypothetical protein